MAKPDTAAPAAPRATAPDPAQPPGTRPAGPSARRIALADGGPLPPVLAALGATAVPPGASGGACALVMPAPTEMLGRLLAADRGPDQALAIWRGWAGRMLALLETGTPPVVILRAGLAQEPGRALRPLLARWGLADAPDPAQAPPDPAVPLPPLAHVMARALLPTDAEARALRDRLAAAGVPDRGPHAACTRRAAHALHALQRDVAAARAEAALARAEAEAEARRAAQQAEDAARREAALAAALLGAAGTNSRDGASGTDRADGAPGTGAVDRASDAKMADAAPAPAGTGFVSAPDSNRAPGPDTGEGPGPCMAKAPVPDTHEASVPGMGKTPVPGTHEAPVPGMRKAPVPGDAPAPAGQAGHVQPRGEARPAMRRGA